MLSLLIAVAVANPPQAPAQARLDPAAVKAASALVQQLGLKGQIDAQMKQTLGLMRQGVAVRAMLAQQPGFVQAYRANPGRFDPTLKKVGAMQAEIAQKVVIANTPAVVQAAVNSYARQYTVAELNGLAAFYRSPLGVALNRKQPRVLAEIGQATNGILGARIDAALQANGARLTAALQPLNSAPPAPPK
ncbi:DUF2059 domain-containing protein [Sandarakinorhabdus sp.]|uniref:DUF2059 domain-containing protein n=1 Tax=Sandarakinorhabdus sp. TaxID=1916663 RepID=UPI00286E47FC|nr:DUF2059 domain-containing protein [Sandarakinorhabdus sp.]